MNQYRGHEKKVRCGQKSFRCLLSRPAAPLHPALDRGTMGGAGPVTLPQGSAHLRARQPGAVQVEGLIMELPGMGGGTGVMLPFHGPKVGLEGRLVVRVVRGVRHSPPSFHEAPSLLREGKTRIVGVR